MESLNAIANEKIANGQDVDSVYIQELGNNSMQLMKLEEEWIELNSLSESLESMSLERLNAALATAQQERIAAEQKMRSESVAAGRSQAAADKNLAVLSTERNALAAERFP